MEPIFTHFYSPIYKSIIGVDMPRVIEVVRKDLIFIRIWWYFEDDTTLIMIILPTVLPLYVPDQIIALEVAR